jgi:hypothetical protein
MSDAERTGFVYRQWDRAPDGKYLDKYDAPSGKRTPNGAVWGHSLDDFFWIQRIPGVNVVTYWSRSMIKEYGERPIDDGNEPHAPRIRRPYPLLKIDKDVECPERRTYSCFDEGSEHGDPVPVEDLGEEKQVEIGDIRGEAEETDVDMQVDSPPPKPKQGKDASIHRSLEEHIPQQFFPDRLIVTDPSSLAFGAGNTPEKDSKRKPWVYERLYPTSSRDLSAEGPVTAELYLDAGEVVGVGHHSNVYLATLTLPKGLSARTPDGKVTVVAKIAFSESEHRSLLQDEAEIFDSFPKYLSEEWCGYNIVPPLLSPVPVGPVVPKFYGYYMPAGEENEELSPILLMEECGTPVNPRKLTREQR